MANTVNSKILPAYEDAILYPVNSEKPQQQQQTEHQHYHVNDFPTTAVTTSKISATTSNISSKTSNLALTTSPSVTPQIPSIQLSSMRGNIQPATGTLNISAQNSQMPGATDSVHVGEQQLDSIDMPAIIIHSAISTPGDDENIPKFPERSTQKDDTSVNMPTHEEKQSGHTFVPDSSFQNPELHSERVKHLHSQPLEQSTKKAEAGFGQVIVPDPQRSIDSSKTGGIKSFEPISTPHKPHLGYRTGIGITGTHENRERNGNISEVYVDVHDTMDNDYTFEPDCPRRNTVSTSDEYQRYAKASKFRNIAKSSGMSSSLDNQWIESSVTDKLLDRPGSKDIRYKKVKPQSLTPQPKQDGPRASLLPSTSKMSKSYSDLSHRHRIGTSPYAYCDNVCLHNHSPSHPTPGTSGSCTPHNKSGSNINKTGEHHHHHHRYHKHQLLPETRSFQGTRGMRSVSENDVRMRSGTDEYEWKDGKVHMKNGGMSHGESVRYVWKDGHVEKITTDANNEDTQVEILETTENKTCSKINPVFICIFLIAVIAIVIILPVYFAS